MSTLDFEVEIGPLSADGSYPVAARAAWKADGTLRWSWTPADFNRQLAITDSAAIRFAQSFYQYVADRRPVDDSVMRARRELRRAKKDSLEWGTPVLYLRALEGRIFDDTMSPQAQPSPSPDRVPTPEAAVNPPPAAHQKLPDPPATPPALLVPFPPVAQTLRHRKRVNAVAFSPDGRRLATACADKIARIWDVTNGAELLTVTHVWLNEATGVAFSPDGRWLATASADRTARVWDASSGRELARVTHEGWVWGMVFSPDGRWLATASKDKTARVWALSGG